MGNAGSCIDQLNISSLWLSLCQPPISHIQDPLPLAYRRKIIRSFEFPQGLACLVLDQVGNAPPESQFQDLPSELLDRVRACLPLSAYIRSSLVSKSWRQTTSSLRMLNLCSELRSPEPWLFALSIQPGNQGAYAFDSEFCRWRKVKLPCIPRDLVYPVAAAAGLLCVNAYADRNQVLFVLNPLRGTSKELPRWKEDRLDPVVGLVVENDSYNFKVVAVGSYETQAITEVYDSATNQWSRTGRLPPQRKMAFACSLFSKGFFYCWTAGPPEALLIYDLANGIWSEMPMLLPSSYAYGKLVEHRGRILLIGISHGVDAFKSVRIWELKDPGKEMEEIARMPYCIFKEFWGRGKGPLVFQIVSSGDLLYLYAKRNPKLVVCNLTKKPAQWLQWMPSSPFCIDRSEVYLFSFCVHPRLTRFV